LPSKAEAAAYAVEKATLNDDYRQITTTGRGKSGGSYVILTTTIFFGPDWMTQSASDLVLLTSKHARMTYGQILEKRVQ
jgi:hypothetical protein